LQFGFEDGLQQGGITFGFSKLKNFLFMGISFLPRGFSSLYFFSVTGIFPPSQEFCSCIGNINPACEFSVCDGKFLILTENFLLWLETSFGKYHSYE
jgi:hypothetical protein